MHKLSMQNKGGMVHVDSSSFALARELLIATLGIGAVRVRHGEVIGAWGDPRFFDPHTHGGECVRADDALVRDVGPDGIVVLTDSLLMNHALIPLEDGFLILGAYLTEAVNESFYGRVLAANHVDSSAVSALKSYYLTLPRLADESVLSAAHTLADHIHGRNPGRRVVRVRRDRPQTLTPPPTEAFEVSLRLLEERYSNENALLRAVGEGNFEAALAQMRSFSSRSMLQRLDDPLRNGKNMMFVIGTLCRKAVEAGGVHPVYIDRLSSEFAVAIERVSTMRELETVRVDILRRYCLLVHENVNVRYSMTVRRAIVHIKLNLATTLSLRTIAAALSVSPAHLSSQFSRETGQPLTAYIHQRRVDRAASLLTETALPVAEIASSVGVHDSGYFSRFFKRITGHTPLEHRAATRRA